MRRLAARILRWALRVWPAESREWGRAIEAELDETQSGLEALRWAMGGVMLLSKAWWREFLKSLGRPLGVPARTAAQDLSHPMPKPRMPRGVIAAMLLAALAILLAPEAREGLREVAASWNLPGMGWTQRELDAMAREAERNGDAETLAFAAMRLPYSAENVRRIELAATLDPRLTWALADVRRIGTRFTATDEHIVRLRHWDSGNAFVELLSAESAAARVEKEWEETHPLATFWYSPGRNTKLELNAEWLAAMQRAFAAPRYDSYVQRRYQLDRSVMQQHGLYSPFALIMGVARHAIPNLTNIKIGRAHV